MTQETGDVDRDGGDGVDDELDEVVVLGEGLVHVVDDGVVVPQGVCHALAAPGTRRRQLRGKTQS